MKTSLSLGVMFAALSTFAACSSEEGDNVRGGAGTGSVVPGGGTGGQTATAGTGGGNSGGAPGTGGTGGAPSNLNLGAAFAIDADGNVVDSTGNTGVDGGPAFAESSVMTVPTTLSTREGGICIKGTTATVPDTSSYGTHWGAELVLDLLRVPNPDAPPPAEGDAGTDAGGALGRVATDWEQGNVIGFAYTMVGNDAAAPDKGVPNARIRFKALPEGGVPANDTYCDDRTPVDGVQEAVLFSDIFFECWAMGNYSLADDPIQFISDPGPPPVIGTRPNPRAFRNIAWQVSSDINVDPIAFDFCVTDIRPILAP